MNTAAVLTIIGLGIGVSINPPGVSLVMLFLMSKDGVRKAWTYVAGSIFAETLIIVGVLALISAVGNVTINPAHKAPAGGDLAALLVAVFGIALVVTAIMMLVKGSTATTSALVERALKDVDAVPGWLAFAIGATLVSWTMPAAVAAEIYSAGNPVTLSQVLVLYLIFMVLAMSTIVFPILVVVRRPERAGEFLTAARAWLERNGGRLAAFVTLAFGLFFVYQGITRLLT